MTPHINAPAGAFAATALIVGDPLRAKFMAESYLEEGRQVCDVRNMLGFSGFYRGKPLSIMSHGMGIPSCSIYCRELIADYGVKNLIRVGTCGGLGEGQKLGDLVIGLSASTDSNVNRTRLLGYDFAATADFHLVSALVRSAGARQISVSVGRLFSTDLFYSPDDRLKEQLRRYRFLGVEMEAAGLYGVAAELGARAVCLCTVSDHLFASFSASPEQRQRGFRAMMEVALDGALLLDESTSEVI